MENFLGNMSDEVILYIAKYSPMLLKKAIYLLILYFTYNPVKEFLGKYCNKYQKK